MADLTTSLITGRVPAANNAGLRRAELVFRLSGVDTEGDNLVPPSEVRIGLEPDGTIPAGFRLWQNLAGYRGTFYTVVVIWDGRDRNCGGEQEIYAGNIQVGTLPSYDLADLINSGIVPGVPGFWMTITQAQYEQFEEWRDDTVAAAIQAAASAASASLYAPAYYPDPASFFSHDKIWPNGTRINARTGEVWDIISAGSGDFIHPVTGQGCLIVPTGGAAISATAAPGTDTEKILTSLRAADRQSSSLILGRNTTWSISDGEHQIARSSNRDMVIDLCGGTIELTGSLLIQGPNTIKLNTIIAADAALGQNFIVLGSVSGIAQGDMLEIVSPAIMWGSTIRAIHVYTVRDVDVATSRVYLDMPLVADITAQQVVDSGATGDITVAVRQLYGGITMRNGTIKIIDNWDGGVRRIDGRNLRHFSIEDCVMEGNSRFQTSAYNCGKAVLRSCQLGSYGYLPPGQDAYGNAGSSPDGQSFGYGMIVRYCPLAIAEGNTATHGWHMIDGQTATMVLIAQNNTIARNSYGVSAHEGNWWLIAKNNTYLGGMMVAAFRSIYWDVSGNHMVNAASHAVAFSGQSMLCRASGNYYRRAPGTTGLFISHGRSNEVPRPGAKSASLVREMIVTGNDFEGGAVIGFVGDASSNTIFEDNKFDGEIAVDVTDLVIVGKNTVRKVGQVAFRCVARTRPKLSVLNNTCVSAPETDAGSALVSVGLNAFDFLDLMDNKCIVGPQYLIRLGPGVSVNLAMRRVISNNAFRRILQQGANTGTIAAFVNNTYDDRQTDTNGATINATVSSGNMAI